MSEPVEVRLLDKTYLVACPEDEREGLQRAARLLDERLRQMKARDRTATLERIAMLAALNLAHERLRLETRVEERELDVDRLVAELIPRIEGVLAAAQR